MDRIRHTLFGAALLFVSVVWAYDTIHYVHSITS